MSLVPAPGNNSIGTVTPINLVTGTARAPIRVGRDPAAIAIAPDGRAAYIVNYMVNDGDPPVDGTVTVLR